MRAYYQYYVEGETEEKLICILRENHLVCAGKVEVFNVIQERLNLTKLRPLKKGTTVVFVFDTDGQDIGKLEENIDFVKKRSNVKEVLCITQVKNLEDELSRACGMKTVTQLFKSTGKKNFKSEFISREHLYERLIKAGFQMDKLWTEKPYGVFENIKNEANKIKIQVRIW